MTTTYDETANALAAAVRQREEAHERADKLQREMLVFRSAVREAIASLCAEHGIDRSETNETLRALDLEPVAGKATATVYVSYEVEVEFDDDTEPSEDALEQALLVDDVSFGGYGISDATVIDTNWHIDDYEEVTE